MDTVKIFRKFTDRAESYLDEAQLDEQENDNGAITSIERGWAEGYLCAVNELRKALGLTA